MQILTVIVSDSYLNGPKSSKAFCRPYCSLETADVVRDILSYLSNYCKALLILINIVISDIEELFYVVSQPVGRYCDSYRFISEVFA